MIIAYKLIELTQINLESAFLRAYNYIIEY